MTVVPIVEGHGDVEATPVLLRRMAQEIVPDEFVAIPHPIRVKRNSVVMPGELERYVELAASKGGVDGRVLVLLDADDDCPAELAPALLDRARNARRDRDIAVVVAKIEFETWFVGAAASVADRLDMAVDVDAPDHPESIADPKRWLTERMPPGKTYKETRHQPSLASSFDMAQTRRTCPSFDKMWRSVEGLLSSG